MNAFLVFDILEGTIDLVAMREKGNLACEQAILPKCLTSWLHVQGVMSDVSSCPRLVASICSGLKRILTSSLYSTEP